MFLFLGDRYVCESSFERSWRFEILRALDCLQVCEVLGGR
jgi:hypothetical protein